MSMSEQESLIETLTVYTEPPLSTDPKANPTGVLLEALLYLVRNTPPVAEVDDNPSLQAALEGMKFRRDVDRRYLTEKYRGGGGDARFIPLE